jgi:hypothetical protein
MSRRYEPGSLDICLEHLRRHRLPYRWSEDDLRVWLAVCPACLEPDWNLSIREPKRGGPISLFCRIGCDSQAIRQALEANAIPEQVEAARAEAAEAWQAAENASAIAAQALELVAEHRELVPA